MKGVKSICLIAIGLLLGFNNLLFAQELRVFNSIPGRAASDHYTCRVKFESEDDGAWREAFVLQTRGKEVAEDPKDGYYDNIRGWTASWIAFESNYDGDRVVVEISKKDGSPITKAMVRPVGDASAAVITDGKAYVTFSEPANVNVDINGQLEDNYTGHNYNGPKVHTITLFANPLYRKPNPNNDNVKVLQPGEDINSLNRSEWDTLIFAPGVHNIGVTPPGDVNDVAPFQILTNEVLYIPGDAVVHGTIHPKNAWGSEASRFWTVYGSGTISGERIIRTPSDQGNKTTKPFTYQAEGARLEGFVVADPAFHTFNMNNSAGTTTNLNIYKNLKILAWRVNSDGVNAFRNSVVTDCFFRVQDDAFYLGSKNVRQQNNVVWNDSNGAVLFLPRADDASTCVFSDVTVIYHRAYWHWWTGGRIISMRESASGASFSDVYIKDILVEDPLPAFPPFFGAMANESVSNVTFNNVIFENIYQEHEGVTTNSAAENNRGKPQNALLGEPNAIFKNITFKNCYYNGQVMTSFADGNFDTAYVDAKTVIFEEANDPPVADFTASATTIAKGQSIIFTDQSANNPTSWSWTFEGGTPETSSSQSPTITYSSAGTYNVDLVATNNYGSDTHTKTGFINVIDSVPVTGVSINNCPTTDLVIGSTTQLSATVSPASATDTRVNWNSSDDLVLKVADNGVLTPVAAGTATITASAVGGTFDDVCEVVVVSVNEIVRVRHPYEVTPGQSINVSVDYISSEPRDILAVFQLDDAPYTDYGSGRISVAAGSWTEDIQLTISPSAPSGVNAYRIVVSLLPVDGVLADKLDDLSSPGMDIYPPLTASLLKEVMKFYPNPADDILNLEFSDRSKRTISILNIAGQLLYQKETHNESLLVDLSSLTVSGQMILKVQSERSIQTRKVFVK